MIHHTICPRFFKILDPPIDICIYPCLILQLILLYRKGLPETEGKNPVKAHIIQTGNIGTGFEGVILDLRSPSLIPCHCRQSCQKHFSERGSLSPVGKIKSNLKLQALIETFTGAKATQPEVLCSHLQGV